MSDQPSSSDSAEKSGDEESNGGDSDVPGDDGEVEWLLPRGHETKVHIKVDGKFRKCRGSKPIWRNGSGLASWRSEGYRRDFCQRCALQLYMAHCLDKVQVQPGGA